MAEDPATPEVSAPTLPAEPAARYFEIWASAISHVLSQIAGKPFAIECSAEAPPDAGEAAETDHRMMVVAAGALRGEMSLRTPRASVISAAQVFLQEPQDAAAEFKSDHQEAFEEFLRQVAGQVATALKPDWGEVQLRAEPGAPPSWAPAAAFWFRAGEGAPAQVGIHGLLSAALHASLAAGLSPKDLPIKSAVAEPSPPPNREGNLDLLLDVELDLTLRFGARSMLLCDILELGAGSVVELDRKVEEPAELLLDGKLIARGEVVVVDGNYGLRVLQVVKPAAAQEGRT